MIHELVFGQEVLATHDGEKWTSDNPNNATYLEQRYPAKKPDSLKHAAASLNATIREVKAEKPASESADGPHSTLS